MPDLKPPNRSKPKPMLTLVRRGLKALEQFRELNQKPVDDIVAKASVAALDQYGVLACMTSASGLASK